MRTRGNRAYQYSIFATLVAGWIYGGTSGCTTAEVEPEPIRKIDPPPYVSAPHPDGISLGDLRAKAAKSLAFVQRVLPGITTESSPSCEIGKSTYLRQASIYYTVVAVATAVS